MQYAAFAAWQDDVLASQPAQLEAERWRQREDLQSLLAPILPGERRGGAEPGTFAPAVQPLAVTPAHTPDITAAGAAPARRPGLTVQGGVLPCWPGVPLPR